MPMMSSSFQVDREPPRVRRGKEIFRGMFEHCAAAGVKATVEHAIAGEQRAAATAGDPTTP
jgi:hypothetical protein